MKWDEPAFRKRLNGLMEERKKNQRETAELIGVTAGAVSRWTKPGDNLPDLDKLSRLADAFGVDLAWLAFGDESTPMNERERVVVELLRNFDTRAKEGFATMLDSFKPQPATAAALAATQGLPADVTVGEAASLEPVIIPVEKKLRQINRRAELANFTLVPQGPAKQRVHGYHGLAAGPGRELERCEDIFYVREMSSCRGYAYARVRGDSMLQTIRPHDAIILQEFDPPHKLDAIGKTDARNPINILRSEVPNDTIWIVQIEDDAPTLKRVRYVTRSRPDDWTLMIEADNRDVWEAYPVPATQTVRFWARLKGLANISQE